MLTDFKLADCAAQSPMSVRDVFGDAAEYLAECVEVLAGPLVSVF